jgi:hypothetical protein
MDESLKDLLKHGRRFERMRTDYPGVFVVKIPRMKGAPSYLALEVNPLDEKGHPSQTIGIIVKNKDELDAIRSVLSHEELDDVLVSVENVNQLT